MFRYEPLMLQNNLMNLMSFGIVGLHRVCMTGKATSHKVVCNLAEMDEFGPKKH